jgi:hypothetical protein
VPHPLALGTRGAVGDGHGEALHGRAALLLGGLLLGGSILMWQPALAGTRSFARFVMNLALSQRCLPYAPPLRLRLNPPAATSCLAQLRIPSPGLARALFELYLGDSSVVPEGRPAWAAGARELLDYDAVKRDTRKAGA